MGINVPAWPDKILRIAHISIIFYVYSFGLRVVSSRRAGRNQDVIYEWPSRRRSGCSDYGEVAEIAVKNLTAPLFVLYDGDLLRPRIIASLNLIPRKVSE